MKRILVFIALTLLATTGIAYAYDTSNALWKSTIRVTNNSTAESGVSVACTINSTAFAANGYADSTLSDIVTLYSSVSKAFMPGIEGYPWMFWVDTIGANQYLDYDMYSSGASGGKYRYFPGATGMTIADDATMEPFDNFSIELSGWFDTSYASANQMYVEKTGAIRVINGASGNITTQIATANWTSPDSYLDPSVHWDDEAKSYDGNTATFAYNDFAVVGWQGWLELYSSYVATANSCRIWVTREDANINNMEIELYYGGAWNNFVLALPGAYDAWVEYPIAPVQEVEAVRINFNNGAGVNKWARVHEIEIGYFEYEIDSIEVSASGISSGEHTVEVGIVKR